LEKLNNSGRTGEVLKQGNLLCNAKEVVVKVGNIQLETEIRSSHTELSLENTEVFKQVDELT
jgi:hypothetical protein